MSIKNTLKYFHCGTLILVLANFIIEYYLSYRLHLVILFLCKITFYLSGLILFFYYIKPFRKKALYFGVFLFSPVIAVLAWIIDLIFGALVTSFLLFWVLPPSVQYKQDDVVVYRKFSGFFGGKVRYEAVENKLYVFQKHLGGFTLDFEASHAIKSIYITENKANVTYKYWDSEKDKEVLTNTILTLK